MAKRSLLRQALGRTRGAARPAPGAEAGEDTADGKAVQGTETDGPGLAELFAALRRGEIPGGGDGHPPDTARTDRLLAELDRAWRAPRAEARSDG
jgi:hypothetical protein